MAEKMLREVVQKSSAPFSPPQNEASRYIVGIVRSE